jgi:hypothetical protein
MSHVSCKGTQVLAFHCAEEMESTETRRQTVGETMEKYASLPFPTFSN